MAFLNEAFDVNTLPQPTNNYEPLPAGWYTVTITDAELKATKDGSGQYIKVRYDITGPSHQGRVVFGNLNIKNASAKAEEIGRSQLAELMRAIGLARVTDTDQLVGGSLSIKLDIREGNGQYGPQNEVRGYKATSGSQVPAFAPAAAPAAQSTASAAPPWAKR